MDMDIDKAGDNGLTTGINDPLIFFVLRVNFPDTDNPAALKDHIQKIIRTGFGVEQTGA
jgi:hypothetical protein